MARGKDREDGPSKNQLRGLTYNANTPKFLRNSITALSGGSGNSQSDGRPPIPTRPPGDRNNGDADDDDDNKLDERDLGDEAPQIVVLNEGKHLTAEEVEVASKDTPLLPAGSLTGPAAKKGSSLRFASNDKNGSSSSGGSKRKVVGRSYEDEMDEGDGGFSDLVKRAKVDTSNATTSKEAPVSAVQKPAATDKAESGNVKEKKSLSKEEKAAMKAKRKQAKKLLSFED